MDKLSNYRLNALQDKLDAMNRASWDDLKGQKEEELRDVWLKAWTATASSTNCINPNSCAKFADVCLTAYKEKFNL